MENLTGGTPPVRYLPCVVPCKLYFHTVEIFSPSVFQMHVEPTEKSLLAGRHAHLPHTAFPSDAYPLEGAVISRFFLPGTLKALTPVHRQKHTREFYSIGTLPAGKISVVGKGWLYTFQPVYLFFQPVNRVRGCGGERERCFWFPWRLTRFFRPQKGTLVPGISGIDFFLRRRGSEVICM